MSDDPNERAYERMDEARRQRERAARAEAESDARAEATGASRALGPTERRVNGTPVRNRWTLRGRTLRDGTDEQEQDEDGAPLWKRYKPPVVFQPKIVFIFLLVTLLVGAFVYARSQPDWPPPPNCEKSALAVQPNHARTGFPIHWVATGPRGQYVVTIAAKSVALTPDGQVRIVEPEPNANGKAQVVRTQFQLNGCRVAGKFDLPLEFGEFNLRMYQVTGTSVREVAKIRVESDG